MACTSSAHWTQPRAAELSSVRSRARAPDGLLQRPAATPAAPQTHPPTPRVAHHSRAAVVSLPPDRRAPANRPLAAAVAEAARGALRAVVHTRNRLQLLLHLIARLGDPRAAGGRRRIERGLGDRILVVGRRRGRLHSRLHRGLGFVQLIRGIVALREGAHVRGARQRSQRSSLRCMIRRRLAWRSIAGRRRCTLRTRSRREGERQRGAQRQRQRHEAQRRAGPGHARHGHAQRASGAGSTPHPGRQQARRGCRLPRLSLAPLFKAAEPRSPHAPCSSPQARCAGTKQPKARSDTPL